MMFTPLRQRPVTAIRKPGQLIVPKRLKGEAQTQLVIGAAPDDLNPLHWAFTVSGGTGPYDWDFGDGDTLETEGASAQHVFDEAGEYTVTVTDEAGATGETTITVSGAELVDWDAFDTIAELQAAVDHFVRDHGLVLPNGWRSFNLASRIAWLKANT